MLIHKIKEFFKRIFRINDVKKIEGITEKIEKNEKEVINNDTSFKKTIKADNVRIQQLQNKYIKGEIDLKDISIKDKYKLASLYIEQINEQLKYLEKKQKESN